MSIARRLSETRRLEEMRLLSELTNEVRKLCFLQNANVQAAFMSLKDEKRFEGWVTLPKVQKIYKQLKERRKTQPISPSLHDKELILSPDVFKPPKKDKPMSFPFHKTDLHHEIGSNLKSPRGFSKDGLSVLYNIHLKDDSCGYEFRLYDTLNNKDRCITAQKRSGATFDSFYFLNEKLGLLFEKTDTATYSSTLMKLNLASKKMEIIGTDDLLSKRSSGVLIDPMHPEKVVFSRDIGDMIMRLQFCEVNDVRIYPKKHFFVRSWPEDGVNALFDGKLYCFDCRSLSGGIGFPSIHVIELKQESESSKFALKWPLKKFRILDSMDNLICCWARDRFYAVVRLEKGGKFGIAWTSCATLKWTRLKFFSVERIVNLQFVTEENILFVQTVSLKYSKGMIHQVQHTSHRIPIKKPDSLSSIAWSSLVQLKRKIPDVDPYEEARKYLPYTSDIRYPFDE